MAANSSTVKISFLGDASQLAKASRQAKGSIESVGQKAERSGSMLGGLGKAFVGAAAAFGAVSMFKDFIGEAEESRRVGRLTAQVIKSTGGAAKVTAGQVGALATAISNKTGIDDEAIQSGANLLLTFTGIRNEVGKGNDIFNQATQTITDMSAALGQDTKSSAIQLGKALNDPIKGVTALQRVGVSFTESQKKQIATLVKSGDTLGAQKLILKELGREFGGAAAAAATPSQKLKVTLDNLKESIGTALLPAVDRVASFLASSFIPTLYRLGGYLKKTLGPTFKALTGGLRVFFSFLKGNDTGVDGPFRTMAVAGDALHRLFIRMQPTLTQLRERFRQVAEWVQTRLLPAVSRLIGFLVSTFTPTFRAIGDYIRGSLIPAWQGLAQRIQDNIGPILKVVGALAFLAAKILGVVLPILVKLAGFLARTLFAALGLAIGIIGGFARALIGIASTVARVVGFVREHWRLIAGILTGPIGAAVIFITSHFDAVVGFVKKLPGRIGAASAGMWDGIKNAFRAVINWIIDKWNGLEFKLPSVDTHIPGVGTVGGFSLGTPNIPRLAEGGIVKARPGGILANIGEGRYDEAVVPLKPGGGGGGESERPIVLQLDSRTVWQGMLRFSRESGFSLVPGR